MQCESGGFCRKQGKPRNHAVLIQELQKNHNAEKKKKNKEENKKHPADGNAANEGANKRHSKYCRFKPSARSWRAERD